MITSEKLHFLMTDSAHKIFFPLSKGFNKVFKVQPISMSVAQQIF